jgi:arabinogalactan oligomer/maltooligosaccharide transport system substrate-binding protein
VINGPWAFQPYEAAGINYGVAPLPTLPDGKPMSSFLGVKGYVVSTWSKDKALAQQFIEFINQPQYVKARYVATGEIPPLKAMIDDPLIKNDEKPARWRCSRRAPRRCRASRKWAKCGGRRTPRWS